MVEKMSAVHKRMTATRVLGDVNVRVSPKHSRGHAIDAQRAPGHCMREKTLQQARPTSPIVSVVTGMLARNVPKPLILWIWMIPEYHHWDPSCENPNG